MSDKLKSLQIDPEQKKRPQSSLWIIFLGVIVVCAVALFFAWPRAKDKQRLVNTGVRPPTNSASPVAASLASPPPSMPQTTSSSPSAATSSIADGSS